MNLSSWPGRVRRRLSTLSFLACTIAATPALAESSDDDLMPEGEAEAMAPHDVLGGGSLKFVPGKGLEAKDAEGKFTLKTRVRAQYQYELVKDMGAEGEEAEPMNRLRMRRIRIVFNGNAFGKKNKYKFEVDALSSTPVLDYYLDFTQLRDFTVRIGQYKLASNRTRVISSGNLQMVDRTILNAEFTLDRDLGIDFRSKDLFGLDRLKYVLGVSMGQGKNNPSFQDFGNLYVARLEYMPFGSFADYSMVDFKRTLKPRLSIGAQYSFFHKAANDRGNLGNAFNDGGTADFHIGYLDAIFKYAGFSATTEVAIRDGRRDVGPITQDEDGNPITPDTPRNGWGFMGQMGYLIPRAPLEVAGRFALVHKLGDKGSLTNRREAAVGFNWYLFQHPLKLQTDFAQLWEQQFDEGEFRFRAQLQAAL